MHTLSVILVTAVCGVEGLLPLDGRWQYPHHLTFRPGDGQACRVNPPRMSWPYVPHVLTGRKSPPLWQFTLQLSQSADFASPDLEFTTPYNFYNALPALDGQRWYWRVGYGVGTDREQWSPARSFQIAADAVTWDRRAISGAAGKLAAMGHPRFGPADGDWSAWRERLEKSEPAKSWLASIVRAAKATTRRSWWKDFPKSDRKGESPYDETEFAKIANELARAAFVYRLTGDESLRKAGPLAVALARFEKGGLSSPEYHGAPRKWPTQITEYLALCYDLLYDELTPEQRKALLESIDWRLRATYYEKYSWRSGETMARSGSALFCQSHPYENFMWSLPGVLLTAGDLEVADELVPMCLNYLTGVTAAHGPDEAWNEGLAYGSWKGRTMLQASTYATLLLPELELGKNPQYERLGQWYRHLLPLGIQRLSFGDYAANPQRQLTTQLGNFRYLAWLTGDGTFAHRCNVLAGERGDRASDRPWLDLLGADRLAWPEADENEPTSDVFLEAGWVMESTGRPSDRAGYEDAVGMIFKCRPRGGFSHSYRAENDFVWYAFGQALSASGGGTAYPDPHSRHSMSHNVVMIDGVGQEWNPWQPKHPYVGRLLAYRRGPDFVHWVGDATYAYQTVDGLLRCHRHVVLLDDRWFVLFDDLAMRPDAKPVRFSWLYHVAPSVEWELDCDAGTMQYRMGDVDALVALAGADSLQIVDQAGRDGFRNPVTGDDLYETTAKALVRKNRDLTEKQWMAHNVWATNREPARQHCFLAVLAAGREGSPLPEVEFRGERSVAIRTAEGRTRVVSFDAGLPGDVQIDVKAVRDHALRTAPSTLPPGGEPESVSVGSDEYRVRWLAQERFDGDLSRWAVEGDSEVVVIDGRLRIRKLEPKRKTTATVWFRPELPQNVLVRFRAKPTEPAEENAANLNLFLHAREADGPLEFGRPGAYNLYHKIPNYIFTLTGGSRSGWARARRDPGFELLHEADVRSDVGTEYEIVVTSVDGRLRYYLDGRKLHDVVDPQPLPGGRFGLRTWSTNGCWDDVEIGAIAESRP